MKKIIPSLLLSVVFTCVFAGNESSFEKMLTNASQQMALKDALKELEKKYKVSFVWTNQSWSSLEVELKTYEEDLDKTLKALLSSHKLSYKKIGKRVYQIVSQQDTEPSRIPLQQLSASLYSIPLAEEAVISGVVTDEAGNPLEGATIKVKNSTTATKTARDGSFSLNITDAQKNSILVISFVGYVTQELAIRDKTSFTISMRKEVKADEEVVVVGYGSRRKKDVSGAVTQVSSEMISKQPITSIDQGLAGLVPGVTLREGTGAPGSGPEILIRGINTFGNNKPLIVIDDVIFENGNDQNNNPLALINPEDIETVTILKDAATKAIYGSRATAGVIIVTTKRGKIGKPKITFNSNVGFANPMGFEKPDVLNATELAQFFKERDIDRLRAVNPLYADPNTPVPDSLIAAQFRNPSQYGKGTDWYDEITRTAVTQSHNISISGGVPNVKYFVSGNYLDQEGVVINNGLKRYAIRANLDVKISDKLRFGINLNPSRTEQNRPADDPGGQQFAAYGTITSTYWIDPSVPVYQPNGFYNYTTKGDITTNWTANPVYQLYAEKEVRRSSQILSGTYLEFEPVKNLIFKTQFNYGFTQNRSQNFKPSRLVGDGSLTPQFPNTDSARAILFNSNVNNLISDNSVRYRLILGKHNTELFAGYSVQDQSSETSTLNAKRLLDENFQLPDFNNVSQATNGNFTGAEDYSRFRLTSIIGRINYAYNNRYLLNFSLRRDGSSRFGRDVQYGNFPAGSVAWRISEEEFMQPFTSKWLNDLKLEIGYGLTGNIGGLSSYGHLGSIGQANYLFGSTYQLGNTLNGLPNPLVTWEKSKQFDLGLSGSFLKRRLSFSANVYQQITEGAIAGIPVSWITGFGSVAGNQQSTIRNRGFEFTIDATPVRNKNFSWTTSVNISKYVNKIVKYYLDAGFKNGFSGNGTAVTVSAPGQPIGMFRGYKTLGLYTAAEIADPTVPKYSGAREGSLKIFDGNGDGKIGIEEDYVILGNPHPDLMFGFSNQVSYKQFSLRAVFAGQFGGLIYDLRREIMWNVDGNFNIDRQMLDRWRPGDDPATKKFPTTVSLAGATTRYVRFPSDNKIYDGTYLGLKNLTFSWNAAKLINSKRKIAEAAEFYIGMRNVFYLAAYKYGNPEVRRSNDGGALRSINYGSYPISRTTTLGINFTF